MIQLSFVTSGQLTKLSMTKEQERPYEAFVEVKHFDQTRAYILNVDASW